jgi:hypothetical protein
MDKENLAVQVIPKQAGTRKRSLFCLVVLYSALTYFLILALLFLAGLIFSVEIFQAIEKYYVEGEISRQLYTWIALGGTLLYMSSVAGILLFIFKKKFGFFIFFMAAVVIFSLDLSFLEFDWLRYLVHSGFIFMLGIAHFSKRCY